MRFNASFAIMALLVTAPFAAAGGIDVGVRYLEDEEARCVTHEYDRGESNSTGDGSWYAYWYKHESGWHESCRDDVTYAHAYARHDDGTLVDASARGSSHASSSGSWSGKGSGHEYWSRDVHGTDWGHRESSRASSSSDSEGWSRTVDVRTAAGDARVDRGCSSWQAHGYSQERSEHWYKTNTSRSSSERTHGQGWYESRSECHERLSAGNVSLARRDACRSTGSDSWGGYARTHDNESYAGEHHESRNEDECFGGVEASTPDGAARAGRGSACERDGFRDASSGDHGDAEHEGHRTDCESGLVVQGPLGLDAFFGSAYEYREYCTSGGNGNMTCSTDGWSARGGRVNWAESPAGPFGFAYWRDLP